MLQGPWQEISIDIIRLLPQSKEKDAIVVVIYKDDIAQGNNNNSVIIRNC